LCALASFLDEHFRKANGAPSLAPLLDLLQRLREKREREPLFAALLDQRYAEMDQVDVCAQQHAQGDLDLVLCREAQRHLLDTARIEPPVVIDGFICALVRRYVIDAKTDVTAADHVSLHDMPWAEIRRVVEPVIKHATRILQERPTAKRLHLKKHFSTHIELAASIAGINLPEAYV
jgi:hypothetical protein